MFKESVLKTNYRKAISLPDKETCDAFIKGLPEKERSSLISFCNACVFQRRIHDGAPITEYFLLHLDEYKTEKDKAVESEVKLTLTIVFVAAAFITSMCFM